MPYERDTFQESVYGIHEYLSGRICESCADRKGLEDIAVKVGFQASATFIRNFKKIVGTAPHQWRSAARGKEDNPSNYNVSVLKGW